MLYDLHGGSGQKSALIILATLGDVMVDTCYFSLTLATMKPIKSWKYAAASCRQLRLAHYHVSQHHPQKRNKPKEAPKAPKSAPFFLPTTGGLEPKFDLTDAAVDGAGDSERILHLGALAPITELGRLLLRAETGETEHCEYRDGGGG